MIGKVDIAEESNDVHRSLSFVIIDVDDNVIPRLTTNRPSFDVVFVINATQKKKTKKKCKSVIFNKTKIESTLKTIVKRCTIAQIDIFDNNCIKR